MSSITLAAGTLAILAISAFQFLASRSSRGREDNLEAVDDFEDPSAFLTTLSNQIPDAVLIVDRNTRIILANQTFLNKFDGEENEIIGKTVQESSLPEEFKEAFELRNRGGNQVCSFSDGNEAGFLFRAVQITGDSGLNQGELILLEPVQTAVQAADFNLDRRELDKLSHDLKTPLNAIMGYSQILSKDENLKEKQRKYLDAISRSSSVLLKKINLFLNEPENQELAELQNRSLKGGNGFDRKSIEKILIVDDVSLNRTLIKIILGRHGYQLLEAQNGMEALEIVEKEAPDLVLMDIKMPKMDGLEALKEIRKAGKDYHKIPVIAVTAQTIRGNKKRLLSEGFDGYLQKPFKEKELLSLIKS